ncbi:hypothetical protein HELRODRAFT_162115 [Helobdella robusta]|uniref:Uncharacterized protein n=1 Tax=Helobdella robusta TaxID=6412 RepID=T1ES91_HELRO|nr:hypothetical protein HELRODRAFT_162115 [Helobdella robusta]ESN98665.1 hypothetical protein HELRODRAFT_162115 [Helobdella robusta]
MRVSLFLSDLLDYCLYETFVATCPRDHVIVMTSAKYGRIRSGRCAIGSDDLGCFVDVMSEMGWWCGGKSGCSVQVRNLLDLHPCGKDYVSYLQASYVCIPGRSIEFRALHMSAKDLTIREDNVWFDNEIFRVSQHRANINTANKWNVKEQLQLF